MRYLIYARVSPKGSTWAGTETTIPDQVAECRGYLLARDPKAECSEVTDEFCSGGDARRPGYRRILDELQAGDPPWDVLVVRHLDRLSRSLADAVELLQLLARESRGLISTTQALDLATPTGRAMLGMLLVFAEWERSMCSERTRSKMVAIAAAGGWPPGHPPYGYRRAAKGDNVLIPDQDKAPRVRALYEAYRHRHRPDSPQSGYAHRAPDQRRGPVRQPGPTREAGDDHGRDADHHRTRAHHPRDNAADRADHARAPLQGLATVLRPHDALRVAGATITPHRGRKRAALAGAK